VTVIEKLFPKQANNQYQGSPIALYGFYLIIAIYSFRSLVHFLAEDAGINNIASIIIFPVIEGAPDPNNVIYLFASLWGSSQLLMLFMFYICMWRYRNLLPLLWLTLVIEMPLRMAAGTMHPLSAPYYEYQPPGAVANLPLLGFACIMLVLSLRSQTSQTKRS
jgi:hypothetical protein